jgi:hypothetical protein
VFIAELYKLPCVVRPVAIDDKKALCADLRPLRILIKILKPLKSKLIITVAYFSYSYNSI